MRRVAWAALFAAATLVPAIAQADTAADYNLFVLNNMNVQGSDTEGRVAVGGNASLQAYSVGAPAGAPGAVNLVVGGNLNANGGSTQGLTVVGGTATYTNWSSAGLQPAGTPLPVDFAAEAIRLTELTDYLAGYAANGSVTYQNWGAPNGAHAYQTTLTGSDATLNVFDLDGTKASDTNTFTINITPGSNALINVSGSLGKLWGAGIFINGGDASNILWNFSDATSLSFYNIGVLGSVLAPNADYNPGGWGVINGQVVVKSFSGNWSTGSTQVNNVYYRGGLLGLDPTPPSLPVPEPATWALMIGGFGLAGAMLRRRRPVAA